MYHDRSCRRTPGFRVIFTYRTTDANGDPVVLGGGPSPPPATTVLSLANSFQLLLIGSYVDGTKFEMYAKSIKAAYMEANSRTYEYFILTTPSIIFSMHRYNYLAK